MFFSEQLVEKKKLNEFLISDNLFTISMHEDPWGERLHFGIHIYARTFSYCFLFMLYSLHC